MVCVIEYKMYVLYLNGGFQMKKKLIAAAFAAMCVAALSAGCGKNSKPNETTEAESESVTMSEELQNETVDYKVEPEDFSNYIKLGDYTGLDIEVDPADVTDDQIEQAKNSILSSRATMEQITDRAVEDGDSIHLQYTGKLDGVPFDGGSTGESGTDYTVGGNYIKDLNDQLIGLECGKEYSLNCTFPEDYGNEELNGKEVVFDVKVDYIYGDQILPEWNDDFVKDYTDGEYTTVADYEKYINDKLAEDNRNDQEDRYHSSLWAAIIEGSEISYPEDKLQKTQDLYYNNYKQYYESMGSYYGMSYEDTLAVYGMTDDSLKDMCLDYARNELDNIIASGMIAQKENITLSQEEYEQMAREYVASSDKYNTIAEFENEYGQDYLYETFIFRKVSDVIYEKNNMVITENASTDAAENTEEETSEQSGTDAE